MALCFFWGVFLWGGWVPLRGERLMRGGPLSEWGFVRGPCAPQGSWTFAALWASPRRPLWVFTAFVSSLIWIQMRPPTKLPHLFASPNAIVWSIRACDKARRSMYRVRLPALKPRLRDRVEGVPSRCIDFV